MSYAIILIKSIFKPNRLTIEINTGIDCTDATEVKIKYRKPNGEIGEWSAEKSQTDPMLIKHKIVAGELNAVGTWTIWSSVTFSDGTAPGEPAKMQVCNEGE